MATQDDSSPAVSSPLGEAQLAIGEVIALVGCIYHTICAGPNQNPQPDLLAACDGVIRMLTKVSSDLCDIEELPQEVAHG